MVVPYGKGLSKAHLIVSTLSTARCTPSPDYQHTRHCSLRSPPLPCPLMSALLASLARHTLLASLAHRYLPCPLMCAQLASLARHTLLASLAHLIAQSVSDNTAGSLARNLSAVDDQDSSLPLLLSPFSPSLPLTVCARAARALRFFLPLLRSGNFLSPISSSTQSCYKILNI